MITRNEKTDLNSYLESCLSIELANRPQLFPVVKKYTNQILEMITSERPAILKILEDPVKLNSLKNDIYVIADYEKKQFRGALGNIITTNVKDKTAEDILQDIENALKKENQTLMKIMPIHNAFGYRILRYLHEEEYKCAEGKFLPASEKLNAFKKFVKRQPGRADDKDVPVTIQLGITKDYCESLNKKMITKLLNQGLEVLEHRTSMDRFAVENQNGVFDDFVNNNMPLVAGPSTHSLSLFKAAITIAKAKNFQVTEDELLEYALAYFTYLTTAGYHTFQEVTYAADLCLNRKHCYDNYLDNIPASNPELYSAVKNAIQRFSAEVFGQKDDKEISSAMFQPKGKALQDEDGILKKREWEPQTLKY